MSKADAFNPWKSRSSKPKMKNLDRAMEEAWKRFQESEAKRNECPFDEVETEEEKDDEK